MARIPGRIEVIGNRILFHPDHPFNLGSVVRVTTTTQIYSVNHRHLYENDRFDFTVGRRNINVITDTAVVYTPTYDATTTIDIIDEYKDIVFYWRATGTIDPVEDYADIKFWWNVDQSPTLLFDQDRESFYSVPEAIQDSTAMLDFIYDSSGTSYLRLSETSSTNQEKNGVVFKGMNPLITSNIKDGYPYTPSFDPQDAVRGRLGYWMKEYSSLDSNFILWATCDNIVNWEDPYNYGSNYKFTTRDGISCLFASDTTVCVRYDDEQVGFVNVTPSDYSSVTCMASYSMHTLLVSGGYLYHGLNNGTSITWNKTLFPTTITDWTAVEVFDVSPMRQGVVLMAAATNPVRLYISYDLGLNWTQIITSNTEEISTISGSNGGMIVVGTKHINGNVLTGSIYSSTDYGDHWTKRMEKTDRGFILATCDHYNGNNYCICTESLNSDDECPVYFSTDNSITWVETLSGKNWNCSDHNYLGNYVLLGSRTDGLWSYHDNGWVQINDNPNLEWTSISARQIDGGWMGLAGARDITSTPTGVMFQIDEFCTIEINTPNESSHWIVNKITYGNYDFISAGDSGVFAGNIELSIDIENKDYNPFDLTISADISEIVPISYSQQHQMCGNSCLYLGNFYSLEDGYQYPGISDIAIIATPGEETIDLSVGRIGFYIFSDAPDIEVDHPIIFCLTDGIDRSRGQIIKIHKDVINFYDGGLEEESTQIGLLHVDINDRYVFLEFSFGGDGPYNWNFYINGVQQNISAKQNLTPLSDAKYIIFMTVNDSQSTATKMYLDNFMIHRNPDSNLYSFRGFDVYTPVIPADPPVPAYDIKFWLTGMKDKYGLPAVRYYPNAGDEGGKDWVNGQWFTYTPSISYPKELIGEAHFSMPSYLDLYAPYSEDSPKSVEMRNISPIDFGGGVRIGFWYRTEGSQIDVRVYFDNSDGEIEAYSISIYPSIITFVYGNRVVQGTYSTLSGESHFIEIAYNSPLDKKIFIDGSEIPLTRSDIFDEGIDVNAVKFCSYRGFMGGDTRFNFGNIIISTNPDLDMYNTIVEGKRLCVLTAYPTKQEDQNWLLWWGCDNDGAQPIIRPDGDYNPLNFTLTFAPNTPEVFMNKEKQMVGNGCLYYLDKDDPIAFGNANLVTTTPFDMNKLNFGLFMYLEDTTSRLSFNISGGNGNGAVMVRLFYDETGVNQYLQLRDKVNNVWAYAFPSAVFQLKTYYFINFIIDNSGDKVVVKLYINNVEHVSSQEWPHFELGNATGSSVGIVNSYADQLMITKDITKDLYALRGFDKFTSELPPEPATPADNIIFWWSGVSNKYGLPAMRHYPNADEDGGQDYIYTGFPDAFVLEDASFSGYERLYPKQIVSNTSPPDSEFNASMTFSVGDVADNAAMVFKTNTTFTQGRIGYWIKYSGQNHAQFILSDYTTYPYPVLTFGIETSITEETKLLLGVRRDPVHIGYGIESTSFSFEENTWYFIEAELSSEMKIYVNGVNIEVSDIISFDTTINLAYVIIGAEDGYKYVQNIMISTDPSINFYEKGYHLLTEYPKLTGSDLLFYHVERLMNTFRGL